MSDDTSKEFPATENPPTEIKPSRWGWLRRLGSHQEPLASPTPPVLQQTKPLSSEVSAAEPESAGLKLLAEQIRPETAKQLYQDLMDLAQHDPLYATAQELEPWERTGSALLTEAQVKEKSDTIRQAVVEGLRNGDPKIVYALLSVRDQRLKLEAAKLGQQQRNFQSEVIRERIVPLRAQRQEILTAAQNKDQQGITELTMYELKKTNPQTRLIDPTRDNSWDKILPPQ